MIKDTLRKVLDEEVTKEYPLDTPSKLEKMNREELLVRSAVQKATKTGSVDALDKIAELIGEKKQAEVHVTLSDTLSQFVNDK